MKESVVLTFCYGPGYIACRKMACRKMNEDVAYARNTESGCNIAEAKQSCYFLFVFDGNGKL